MFSETQSLAVCFARIKEIRNPNKDTTDMTVTFRAQQFSEKI